jgi:hypothetical protein
MSDDVCAGGCGSYGPKWAWVLDEPVSKHGSEVADRLGIPPPCVFLVTYLVKGSPSTVGCNSWHRTRDGDRSHRSNIGKTCASALRTWAADIQSVSTAGSKPDYGRGRSSSTTFERSCTRSMTTSRPSGEMSKSRMSNSGVRLVNWRSAPVSKSMSQRSLCC